MTTDQPAIEPQVADQSQIDLQFQLVVAELQKLFELLRHGQKDANAWTDLIRLYVQCLLAVKSAKGTFARLIHIYLHTETLISLEAKSRRAIRKAKSQAAKK